jgi:hypothetical protein
VGFLRADACAGAQKVDHVVSQVESPSRVLRDEGARRRGATGAVSFPVRGG